MSIKKSSARQEAFLRLWCGRIDSYTFWDSSAAWNRELGMLLGCTYVNRSSSIFSLLTTEINFQMKLGAWRCRPSSMSFWALQIKTLFLSATCARTQYVRVRMIHQNIVSIFSRTRSAAWRVQFPLDRCDASVRSSLRSAGRSASHISKIFTVSFPTSSNCCDNFRISVWKHA